MTIGDLFRGLPIPFRWTRYFRRSSSSRSRSPHAETPPTTFNTPPPPYTPRAALPSTTQRYPSPHDIRPSTPDKYSALNRFDTLFLIDDSGSMDGSNWKQTAQALSAVVPVCVAHDSDGVDIYFLNNDNSYHRVKSAEEVLGVFGTISPYGPTPMGKRLGEILERYLREYKKNKKIKPLNIIVITDGEPTDPTKLERNIVNCARELDKLQANDRQIGIQFFQVGCDQAAMDALEELDNTLVETYGVRDMVDTVPWKRMEGGQGLTSERILKVVLGAVDKRLDRTRAR